jgi:hypothetical protein
MIVAINFESLGQANGHHGRQQQHDSKHFTEKYLDKNLGNPVLELIKKKTEKNY